MLNDHTGLYMIYQLRRTGVEPIEDRLAALEVKVQALAGGGT
jgi:hypothetical protein